MSDGARLHGRHPPDARAEPGATRASGCSPPPAACSRAAASTAPRSRRSPPRPGFSTGALYSNFDGKEDLFLVLMEREIDEHAREIADGRARARRRSPSARPAARRQWMTMIEREPELLLLFMEFWAYGVRDARGAPEGGRALRADARACSRGLIADGVRDFDLELAMPAEQLAIAIDALADGIARQKLADPDAVPDELMGDVLGAAARRPSRARREAQSRVVDGEQPPRERRARRGAAPPRTAHLQSPRRAAARVRRRRSGAPPAAAGPGARAPTAARRRRRSRAPPRGRAAAGGRSPRRARAWRRAAPTQFASSGTSITTARQTRATSASSAAGRARARARARGSPSSKEPSASGRCAPSKMLRPRSIPGRAARDLDRRAR